MFGRSVIATVLAALYLYPLDTYATPAAPPYRAPYEFYRLEIKDTSSAPLDVPPSASALPWPYKDILEILVATSNQTSGRGRSRLAGMLPGTFLLMGPEAVPPALAFLRDGDRETRGDAAQSLHGFVVAHRWGDSPETRAMVERIVARNKALAPAFLEALKTDTEPVRMTVAFSLGIMGLPPEMYAPALIEALHDPSDHVKVCAAWGLGWGEGGPLVPRTDASKFPPPPDFIAYVHEQLSAGSTLGEGMAGFATLHLPLPPAELQETVRALLTSPSPENQKQGLQQLQSLGDGFRGVLSLALKAVETLSESEGFSLNGLPLKEEDIIQVGEMLKSRNVHARIAVARALNYIGDAAKPAAPMLRGALDDPDLEVRRHAIEAFSHPAFAGMLSVDELVALLHKQEAAADAVEKGKSENGASGMGSASEQESIAASACAATVRMLGKMGPAAASAVDEIGVALKRPHYTLQEFAVSALQQILTDHDCLANLLLQALPYKKTDSIVQGLLAAGKAQKSSAGLIAARYREAMNGGELWLNTNGKDLLGVVAQLDDDCLAVAAEGLLSKNLMVRVATLDALGSQAGRSLFALPRVLLAMKDEDNRVRIAAIRAACLIAPADEAVRKTVLKLFDNKDSSISACAVEESLKLEFNEKETRLAGRKLMKIVQTRGLTPYMPPLPPPMPDGPPSPPIPQGLPPRVWRPFIVEALAKYCAHQTQDLIRLSNSSERHVKRLAGDALQLAHINATDTIDALKVAMEQDPSSLSEEVRRLIDKGVAAGEVIQVLVDALNAESPEAQNEVASTLGFMREKATPAIPALIALLKPDEPLPRLAPAAIRSPRCGALLALKDIGWGDDAAVKALISLARNTPEPNLFLISALMNVVQERREHGM